MIVPNYLRDYSEIYLEDPHKANLAWFKDARWGLFMHYGLYAQLARGEWVMFREQIPIPEYEKLFNSFDVVFIEHLLNLTIDIRSGLSMVLLL